MRASRYCSTWLKRRICRGLAASCAASCVYPIRKKKDEDEKMILLQCGWPQTLCTAALTRHGSWCEMNERWPLAGEMNSAQQWNGSVNAGPPIVLILKIPLEQAFFFSVPVIHTLIVLQWTIAEPAIRLFNMSVLCAYVLFFILHLFIALLSSKSWEK